MDEHAIGGLRRGDPDAWRALYDEYAERVWREVARRLGPHPADIADVVQETMLAAARSARTFDSSKGSLWQWLSGIARVQVAQHYRQRQRHERWKQSPVQRSEGVDPPSTSDLESSELAAQVRAALDALPGDYGALLTAKYLDGESVADLAGRERITEVALRSKLARAREAFRRAFTRIIGPNSKTPEAARELL